MCNHHVIQLSVIQKITLNTVQIYYMHNVKLGVFLLDSFTSVVLGVLLSMLVWNICGPLGFL